MEIRRVIVGYLEENCYLIKKDSDALIVDPGDEIDKILSMIGDLNVVGILITHAHFDHIGALDELLKIYDVPVYYYNINSELNYKKLIKLKEQDYKIKKFKFNVIYTPGHRNDSVTFYFEKEKIMFTGDFLFKLSIGRTDLEYGDDEEMLKSIKKIKNYDNNMVIYPGHGDFSNLGYEKINNYFLKN